MLLTVPVPYIVYWLVVKDFLFNVDVCENDNNEPGHCLSNSQCNSIFQGENIGPCGSGTSGSVCCKITMNYFNETYLLNQMFVRKTQTETKREMRLFDSDNACSRFQIQYGNKTISSEQKRKVYYDSDKHVSKTPDRIMWPIWASYSRQSRNMGSRASGQSHLYAVSLDKLETDMLSNKTAPVSECVSESDDGNDQFYFILNPAEIFPIRKFFTRKIQKLNTMNLTNDFKRVLDDLDEVEPLKLSRRSLYQFTRYEDSFCKKEHLEDILVPEENIIQDGKKTVSVTHKEIEYCDSQLNESDKDGECSLNYKLKSKSILLELMGIEDTNEQTSSDSQYDKMASDTLISENQLCDSRKANYKDFNKRSVIREEISQSGVSLRYTLKYEVNEATKYFEKPVVFQEVNDMPKPAEIEADQYLQKPVKINKSAHAELANDFRKSVQKESTLDLHVPVQIKVDHNMKKPESERKSVRQEITHDLRKPVALEESHDLRKPVALEESHDLRKPVALEESHDLRWPVLEENDLHIPAKETDLFENGNYQGEFSDLTNSPEIRNINADVTSYNPTLDCKNILFSNKLSNMINLSGKPKELNLWEEATKICGKYNITIEAGGSKLQRMWPWMVSVHEKVSGKFSHKCSASLINSFWVVTVAHCVDMKLKSEFVLVVGNEVFEHSIENRTEIAIEEIVMHPKFKRGRFENDVALLRIKTPVAFQSTVSPICLPWSVGELTYGIPVYLGMRLKDQRTADNWKNTKVPLINNYECEILYSTAINEEKIKDTFLCAGKDDGNCDSESGSSLIALDSKGRWSLIGLISWGSTCENAEQPGVYIRLSNYAQWIKDVIDCYEFLM